MDDFEEDIELLAQRIGWLERKATRLLRSVIAMLAAFMAWGITKSLFHDQWDFVSVGTAVTIFLVLSGGVQWLEFRDAPAHVKFIS